MLWGTCYGAKATGVPLPKLRVWGRLQCFLSKMDLFYKAKIGNTKLAKKEKKKNLPSTAKIQNTQFREHTYHACYLDTIINSLLKGSRTKAGLFFFFS